MVVIGGSYLYDGVEVVVEDGDRADHSWTVTVVSTGRLILGVMTSQLKDKHDTSMIPRRRG